jgi:alkylation response protein AidB-like acyl-CoA dehydrogenase
VDLSLSQSQQMARNAARDFVRGQTPKEFIVGLDNQHINFSRDIWNQISSLGWVGALIPADYGGEDMSILDTAVIFEELGRGPVPGPFFESGVLSSLILLEGGSEDQKKSILPNIATGQRIFALAALDPSPRWGPEAVQMTATKSNGSYTLNGAKPFVHYAGAADSFLVAARTSPRGANAADGITLFVVDKSQAGVGGRDLVEGTQTGFGEVTLENVSVPESAVVGGEGNGWKVIEAALQKALPVLNAYCVGGLETVCEYALSYSQTRIVFAQPIGRFQRVQDRIIEAVNHRDAARWTTWEAIWKLETGRPSASAIHLSKAVCSDGYYDGTNLSTEVHAGIGIEDGTGLNVHIKMSRGLYSYLGDPRYHRRRMVDALY